jgi:hypothetical protein
LPIPPLDGGRIAVSLLPQARGQPHGHASSRSALFVIVRCMFTHCAGRLDPSVRATRLHGCCAMRSAFEWTFVARALECSLIACSPGMRPTGRMHIGHYHGALKNWIRLQEEYECLFFAADWHALTTHYETPETIADMTWEMFDRLARRRARSDARHAVHPVARAGARRARAAARHDDARRLARARARPTRTSSRSSPTRTCRTTASSAIR